MELSKKVSLIFYRFKERGLEVFMLNKSDEWGLPEGEVCQGDQPDCIELDPSHESDEALAMEGDWHEIPSLKGMLYEDAQLLKEKLKEIEGGAYVTIKDALKKRLSPAQYEFLKELKDILTDRNSVRDI
ncbi:MAG: hypothetical protein AAF741_01005 [Bacteroidota bacterium]